MGLTSIQKQRLINNLDETISQINYKRKNEYKVIDALKNKAWFWTFVIIMPIIGFLIFIAAVVWFAELQSQPGAKFANKVFGAYNDSQILCIVIMVLGCALIVLSLLEYIGGIKKAGKLAVSLNNIITNNKAFKFYGKVDSRVKKICDVTSVDLSRQTAKANFWIELDKDLSQAVDALEQLKNQLMLNSDDFIEQISSKTGEDALIFFSDTI
ncbi:hypothetical protein ACNQ2A_02700 [Mycoplasma sp. 1458C]|uniref:hypothetical protein n=1 Tax=Mycoplasma sp. 1458C TaxID=3401661 RepID=UPI003AABDB0D